MKLNKTPYEWRQHEAYPYYWTIVVRPVINCRIMNRFGCDADVNAAAIYGWCKSLLCRYYYHWQSSKTRWFLHWMTVTNWWEEISICGTDGISDTLFRQFLHIKDRIHEKRVFAADFMRRRSVRFHFSPLDFSFKEKLSMIGYSCLLCSEVTVLISFAHQIGVTGLDVFQDVLFPYSGEENQVVLSWKRFHENFHF